MYTTSKQQIASAEAFIKGLPDSIVKGNYERWLAAIKLKGGITTEQLEKFVALSNALPKEFQNYPQEFALNIKNMVNPVVAEVKKTEPIALKAEVVDKKAEPVVKKKGK